MFVAVDNWKNAQGHPGSAIPTFEEADYGQGVVYGVTLLKPEAIEWRDVTKSELGGVDLSNFEGMFQAVNDYALSQGFAAAYPTFQEATGPSDTVYGVVLIKPGFVDFEDVPAFTMNQCTKVTIIVYRMDCTGAQLGSICFGDWKCAQFPMDYCAEEGPESVGPGFIPGPCFPPTTP
jgi:hypothetical protein